MKRSKTNKEIFEQKYPVEELSNNPLLCVEAIGYLKAISEYFPTEENWVTHYTTSLLLLLSYSL